MLPDATLTMFSPAPTKLLAEKICTSISPLDCVSTSAAQPSMTCAMACDGGNWWLQRIGVSACAAVTPPVANTVPIAVLSSVLFMSGSSRLTFKLSVA